MIVVFSSMHDAVPVDVGIARNSDLSNSNVGSGKKKLTIPT